MIETESLKYYVNVLPDDIQKDTQHKFENGVIITKIPYGNEYYHHGTAIASFVIRTLGDEDLCTPNINWLLDNMDKKGAIWHDFVLPFYDFDSPWVGGLAQGLTISALLLAYDEYQDKEYKKGAIRAFNGLVSHCVHEEKNETWFCEYPGVYDILNGNLYILFGVFDMVRYTANTIAISLYDRVISTLMRKFYLYNLGYWSSYRISRTPASHFYHTVHIEQLSALIQKVPLNESEKNLCSYLFNDFVRQRDSFICQKRASYKRFESSLSKHGLYGSYKQYRMMKRWKNDK